MVLPFDLGDNEDIDDRNSKYQNLQLVDSLFVQPSKWKALFFLSSLRSRNCKKGTVLIVLKKDALKIKYFQKSYVIQLETCMNWSFQMRY